MDEYLVREVFENDPRYKETADISLSDATLGDLGKSLDVVFNPLGSEYQLSETVSDYLGCDPEHVIETTKQYPIYKSPLIRSFLPEVDGYEFSNLRYGSDDWRPNHLEVIPTGPNSTRKIPVNYTLGASMGDQKLVISTQTQPRTFILRIFTDGRKPKSDSLVDGFLTDLEDTVSRNNYYRKQRLTPGGQFLSLGGKSWEDIQLPEEIKDQIRNNITNLVEKADLYRKNGVPSKRGLIFAGKPGTGKTLACKILASTLKDFTFIWVTANDVYSAEDVHSIYTMARELSPSIVLLEDSDLFCSDRNYGNGQSILGEILSQLDGLVELDGVVTIMTTNQPGSLDKALIDRPGRFDIQIVFDPPSDDAREKILKKALEKVEFNPDDISSVVSKSEGLTGAELQELVNLAIIYAIDSNSLTEDGQAIVTSEHLTEALGSNIQPPKPGGGPKAQAPEVMATDGISSQPQRTVGKMNSSYLETAEKPIGEVDKSLHESNILKAIDSLPTRRRRI